MRRLHISNYQNWGGGTAIARLLANGQADKSALLFLEPAGHRLDETDKKPPEHVCGFRDFSFVRSLAQRMIREDGAVIVHCHGRRPGLWGQLLRALYPRQVRTVLSFHGIASFQPAKKAVVAAQQCALSLVTDRFVAAGKAEVDMFRMLPLAAPILLVPYSYNADAVVPWTPRRLRRLGFCARFEHPKLHEELIRCVAAYNSVASAPVELVFCGDGSLRPHVDDLARQLLGEHYVSLGHVTHISEFYSRIDAFAYFSQFEGLPVGLLDAMACGMPCMATNVIGCRDAIEDGVSGLLVPPGDTAAGAAAIRRLVEDQGLAEQLAANARSRAEALYSPGVFLAAHEAIYSDLAGELRMVGKR